jgi:hypothetical protein
VQNKAKCSTNLQQYKTGKRFSHIILCIKKFFHQLKEITAQVKGKTEKKEELTSVSVYGPIRSTGMALGAVLKCAKL